MYYTKKYRESLFLAILSLFCVGLCVLGILDTLKTSDSDASIFFSILMGFSAVGLFVLFFDSVARMIRYAVKCDEETDQEELAKLKKKEEAKQARA